VRNVEQYPKNIGIEFLLHYLMKFYREREREIIRAEISLLQFPKQFFIFRGAYLHLIFVDSWDQNKPSSDKNF
jgi:hypothetical protein